MKSVNPTEPQSQATSENAQSNSTKTTTTQQPKKNRNYDKYKDRVHVGLPKKPNGQIDKELVKEMFYKSVYFEWAPFAQENDWEPNGTYGKVPAKIWIEDKRIQAEKIHISRMRHAVFDTKQSLEENLVGTLKNSPLMARIAFKEVARRMNSFNGLSNEEKDTWSNTKIKDLFELAEKVITMQQKALFMDRMSLAFVKENPDATAAAPEAFDEQNSSEWKINIIGMGEIDKKALQQLSLQYYDKKSEPAQPIEIHKITDEVIDIGEDDA